MGTSAHTYPLRITGVQGYNSRSNDLIYCRPLTETQNSSVVTFFGGDVQDFTENMQSHRDNRNYTKWNLENTAKILQERFPSSHIVIVKPVRMEYKTFSCFENFVPCSNCGSPEHVPMNYALHHLEALLKTLSEKLRTMSVDELTDAAKISKKALLDEETVEPAERTGESSCDQSTEIDFQKTMNDWVRKDIKLDASSLILIGFSKGCVVLNQFLHEFHHIDECNEDAVEIIGRIEKMYWLDGGHSGGKNTWITTKEILQTLGKLGIEIQIHVTPYQMQDDRRPWIKKEEKAFYGHLCAIGANVYQTLHYPNETPNLHLHFNVIKMFHEVV